MQDDGGDVRIVNAPCNQGGSEVKYDILNAVSGEVNVSIKVSEISGSEINYSVYYGTSGTTTTTEDNSVPDRPFDTNWDFELGNENYWTFNDISGGGWDISTTCTNGNKIGTYCAECWQGSDARQGDIYSDTFYLNTRGETSKYFNGDGGGQAGGIDLDCNGNVDISMPGNINWANVSTINYVGHLACWRFEDHGTAGADWSVIDHMRIFDGEVSVTENPLWLESIGDEETLVTDTCTYSSGNWNVNCSDNCTITSNVVGDTGSNLSISGTGKFIIDANISGFTKYHIDGNCVVTCRNGCFKG